MLATLLRPTQRRFATAIAGRRRAWPALRARIGVLGHDLFLYPELTARENLAFFAGLYGCADAAAARARGARARPVSPIAATIPSRASRAACGSASRSSGR